MSVYLFDGATPWTDATATDPNARLKTVKAHGAIAVSVYIVGSPGGMRHANTADVVAARALGLGVIPNWERASDFFSTCTLAEAKQAGVEALGACRALRFPDNAGIGVPFSFDFQCPPSRYGEMIDKLHAASQGLAGGYEALGYGQSGLCDAWAINGLPGPHWLMASTWGMPYNPASPNVALAQAHDAAGHWLNSPVAGTDINTITQPSRLHAWWPDGSPYGGDMPLTAADVAAIWDKKITDPEKQTYTAAEWLWGSNINSWNALQTAEAAKRELDAMKAELDAMKQQLATAGTTGVDVAALAAALAQHLQLEAK